MGPDTGSERLSGPPYFLDRPPFIARSGLPQSEQKSADHLNVLLGSMHDHTHGFRCALRLFDHARATYKEHLATVGVYDPDRDYGSWVFMAARSGVMDVYHIAKLLGAVRKHIGRCPTLAGHIDPREVKIAQQQFESYFPRIRRLRHAIAHAADMIETPESYEVNFRIDNDSLWVVSVLINRMIAFAHEGEQIYVEISEMTLSRLETITRRVFDAIRPAADAAFALPTRPHDAMSSG